LENIKTDADAIFDTELNIKAEDIEPMITYGTNPGMGGISKSIPTANQVQGGANTKKSLAYMGFEEDDVMRKPLILFS
jgi:3-isopropylmalate/(R)-2-methylmalate dehydratase large subunit